jgi:nucleosome binding factor SPN SPT16 subunit
MSTAMAFALDLLRGISVHRVGSLDTNFHLPLSCFKRTECRYYVQLPKVRALRPYFVRQHSNFLPARVLSQVTERDTVVPVELLVQAKGKDAPSEALTKFSELYLSRKRVGCLIKEAHSGKLLAEWDKLISQSSVKPELVDLGPALSGFMSVKDADELVRIASSDKSPASSLTMAIQKIIRKGADLTSTLLTHHIAVKLEAILDREAKITHDAFAAQIEMRLGSGEGDDAKGPDMRVWSKGKGLGDVSFQHVDIVSCSTGTQVDWLSTEFCYSPIIQSQNTKSGYDLRSTAESSKDDMAHKGVLLAAVGIRYKNYCTNVGRTFIVDPSKVFNVVLQVVHI